MHRINNIHPACLLQSTATGSADTLTTSHSAYHSQSTQSYAGAPLLLWTSRRSLRKGRPSSHSIACGTVSTRPLPRPPLRNATEFPESKGACLPFGWFWRENFVCDQGVEDLPGTRLLAVCFGSFSESEGQQVVAPGGGIPKVLQRSRFFLSLFVRVFFMSRLHFAFSGYFLSNIWVFAMGRLILFSPLCRGSWVGEKYRFLRTFLWCFFLKVVGAVESFMNRVKMVAVVVPFGLILYGNEDVLSLEFHLHLSITF